MDLKKLKSKLRSEKNLIEAGKKLHIPPILNGSSRGVKHFKLTSIGKHYISHADFNLNTGDLFIGVESIDKEKNLVVRHHWVSFGKVKRGHLKQLGVWLIENA